MKSRKRPMTVVALAVFALFYAALCVYWAQSAVIDSDYSNLVLEANDIIHGNALLSGWNLTGISFLTTDLLFFETGALFGGLSPLTYYIAVGLMVFSIVLLGLLLCTPSERTFAELGLYFLLCALPCSFAMSVLRAHTGTICWSFLLIWAISRERKQHSRKLLVIAGLSVTLGCLGDAVCLLVGVLPILVLCGLDLLSEGTAPDKKTEFRTIAVLTGAVLCSQVLDKLYFRIGGANKNNFLGTVSFEPIENLPQKTLLYIKSVFMIMDADFFEQPLLQADTLAYLINTVLILLGLLAMARSLLLLFTHRERADYISSVLSLGVVITSTLFILTSAGVDVNSARYHASIVCAFAVLIVRNREPICTLFRLDARSFFLILLGLSLLSTAFRAYDVLNYSATEPKQKRLAAFLESNGLEEGYASFWNASSTTVLSHNRVKVRSIMSVSGNISSLRKHNWFCKDDWYSEQSHFVIASEEDQAGVTPENVENALGAPDQILSFEDLTVLVYDRDISADLFNGLSDGLIKPGELFFSGDAEWTPERNYILNRDAVLFGPYVAMEPGKYLLTYYGDHLDLMDIDVFSDQIGLLDAEEVSESENQLRYMLTIPCSLPDVEFREYNDTNEWIRFDCITVESVEDEG